MAHPSPRLSVPIEIRLRVGAGLAAGMAHKTGLSQTSSGQPSGVAGGRHGPVAIYIAS